MRRAARASAGSAVALALAALAAGCGGDDGPRSTTPASKVVGETAEADAAIVVLVQVRGARLNLGAARLFGDRARLADAGFVRTVAEQRAAAAERLRGQAVTDAGTLARLAGSASISTASAGEALVGFESCARLGIRFFGTTDSDPDRNALREADRTCGAARRAYRTARAELRPAAG